MLSEKLQSLAEHFARFTDTGVTLEPVAAKAIVGMINALTVEADALERAVVPTAARTLAAPAGTVVDIATARRKVRSDITAPSGGDAA